MTGATPHVLLVEDDPELAGLLERAFSEESYRVRRVRSGEDALHLSITQAFDLIVLDVLLPGLDGLETLRRLRRLGCQVPVVILTAFSSPQHRVESLDASADDYIAKPFHLPELLARMRAVRRRAAGMRPPVWRVGDVVVDEASGMISRRGERIPLTRRQYRLLEALLRNSGQALERYQLAELAWDGDPPLDSNAVDVHIAAIRRRIDVAFGTSNLQTVRGLGYRWDPRANDVAC